MNELKGTKTNLPTLPFTYGEYIDFVGGRTWSNFASELTNYSDDKRLSELKKFEKLVSSPEKYFANQNQSQKLLLEMLYLKVSALLRVCRIVQDYHKVTKCNFGNISETSFRVGMTINKVFAPGLWTASVEFDSSLGVNANAHIRVNSQDKVNYAVSTVENNEQQSVDHYALGILLFRTFIVNHRQSIGKVSKVLKNTLDKISHIVDSEIPANRKAAIEKHLDISLKHEIFLLNNIYFKPGKKFASLGFADVWNTLLMTGLRLLCCDIYQRKSGSGLLANEWLSINASVRALSEIKNNVKNMLLYESPNTDKDLYDIISELVPDKEWLNASLQLIRKPNQSRENGNNKADFLVNNMRHKHIEDIRSILNVSAVPDHKYKLELVDDVDKDDLLKSTVAQNASFDKGGLDEW